MSVTKGKINLVKEHIYIYIRVILNTNHNFLFKRHWNKTIKSLCILHSHIRRYHISLSSMGNTEKVTKWYLYTGIFLSIPKHSQNKISQMLWMLRRNRTPYFSNRARTVFVKQNFCRSCCQRFYTRAPFSPIVFFSAPS